MTQVPSELKYTQTHEWARLEDNGTITVGITQHASELLGDMVFVELPENEAQLAAGNECAVVESVKTAADVYSPLNGQVLEVNEALVDDPTQVSADPYGTGWLFVLRPDDDGDWNELMDSDGYVNLVEEAE